MPLQNRVSPYGDLVAVAARGLVYGNRGCLHDDAGRIRRRYAGRRWIACRLSFRGWHRTPLQQPGRFTELFFLDEATALAAGHRPCALCRRSDYDRFVRLWTTLHPGERGAEQIDRRLHAERLDDTRRGPRTHRRRIDGLPDGTMVADDGQAWAVRGRQLLRWSAEGYTAERERPSGVDADVLTPASLVAVLATGWTSDLPLLYAGADHAAGQPELVPKSSPSR